MIIKQYETCVTGFGSTVEGHLTQGDGGDAGDGSGRNGSSSDGHDGPVGNGYKDGRTDGAIATV